MKDEQQTCTLATNETDNGLHTTQDNEATNALQLRKAHNMLKLLALDEAIRKTRDALHKAQNEIEALKKSGGNL